MAKADRLPAKENRRPAGADDSIDYPFLFLLLLLLYLEIFPYYLLF